MDSGSEKEHKNRQEAEIRDIFKQHVNFFIGLAFLTQQFN